VELMDDYSGRGMFGNTTHAVFFYGTPFDLIKSIINHAYLFEGKEIGYEGINTDNMGLGMVVY
jgi:hypothetical protein